MNVFDARSLPYETYSMGKSLKHATNERPPRISNMGEGWHCGVDKLSSISVEDYNYFYPTTEDVSRYRIFKVLKNKNDAAPDLKNILAKKNSNLD